MVTDKIYLNSQAGDQLDINSHNNYMLYINFNYLNVMYTQGSRKMYFIGGHNLAFVDISGIWVPNLKCLNLEL